MPEIVQEIGAYAGLASVVGLAVLSALYFSQARDVKRLREWAGRAPERAEQGTPGVPGRVVGQEQAASTPPQVPTPPPVPGRPATPAKPTPAKPTPAGAPATAAAATGAAAATAQQSKQTPAPAGQNASGGDDPTPDGGTPKPATPATAGAQPTNGNDKPAEGAQEKPAEVEKKDEDKQPAAAPAASAGPSAPAPPASAPPVAAPATAATPAAARATGPPKPPPSPARFQRPGVTSRHSPQETAILPPRKGLREGMSARYIAIGLVGLLVLGGAAVFGVTQLTGDDGGSGSSQAASENSDPTDGQSQPKQRNGGGVKPGSVTVAVLNGTTVPGLAATLSDEIGAAGFKVGTITNFSDQQLAESVVQYAPGHEAEARAVSRKLGITQREPVNPSSQALAGDATVIVIAGSDKSP